MTSRDHLNANAGSPTRRHFLTASGLAILGAAAPAHAQPASDPIIDIHQHLNYSGRSDAALLAHQNAMGVTSETFGDPKWCTGPLMELRA